MEEVGLKNFEPIEGALRAELRKLVAEKELDIACLMVTDITRHYSLLLIEAPEKVIEHVDYPRLEEGIFELEEVVSRKKQLFPWISALLRGLE